MVRLITRLNIGGPARQALSLTRELRPEFDTVLAAGVPTPEEGELTDPQVEVNRVPLTRPVAPRIDLRGLVAVRRLLADHRAELLHTHMAKAGTLGRLAAITGRRRPVTIHTFHGHVLDGYFGARTQRAFIAAERILARRTDVLVAISPLIRDQLLELGIGRPEQYRVIPLGFDLREHLAVSGPSGRLRERLAVPTDVPLAGIVGRLVPIKDHATTFAAMGRLPDVHLAVLGDGELRASLEALAAAEGLTDRVHFVGWWTDIPAAMADLDVIVLSSRNEGTPVSLIEAAACGRPVVTTDVGGVRSVVAHDETGLLVPAGDAEALSDAIGAVLADSARAKAMGAAGRRSVERFTLERLTGDIRALYRELLARS